MKSVYAKYKLLGPPELGDSSKTKVLLLFVQGVVLFSRIEKRTIHAHIMS